MMSAKPSKDNVPGFRWANWLLGVVFVVALILALRALALMSDSNSAVYRLASAGWGKLAEVIIQNKIGALWHAVFMTVCAGAFLWLFCRSKVRNRTVLVAAEWLLIALIAADAFLLSRHYIKTMPAQAFAENDVIRFLKSEMIERRVALLSQDGFYNLWLTFLFPYHGIKAVNMTQMPRLPSDYKRFLEAVGRNPLRFWQLSAVGSILAPAQAWGQFQNDPAMKEAVELAYAYNVKPADYYVEVIPATPEQPGQHIIMRFKLPAPRFALVGQWERVEDAEVLKRLGTAEYHLFESVMVAPECAASLPKSSGTNEPWQVQLVEYRPGKMRLRTSCSSPAILRVAEKYDPDWRAWIDGREGHILRVDFIFQGIYLEPGMHEVLLEYYPARWPLLIQAAGFLLFASALAALLWMRRKRSSAGTQSC